MNAYDVLSRRAVGEKLPLSIGTAIALEALEDNVKYGSLWINLRTLFRNVYDSVETDMRKYLSPTAVVDTIIEELGYINEYSKGKIDHIQVYHREYADLLQRFPKAIIRVPNTPLQKSYDLFMHNVIDEVLRRDTDRTIDFNRGSQLAGKPVVSLIITHYPLDLLSRTQFTKLRLLESYTGLIKSKSQWNTKLTDGKLLKEIPFNEFTIQLFGDGPVQFMRYPKKTRDAIIELASEYKWSSMTTMEKVKQNLNWMKDRYSMEILKQLL